MYRRWLALLLFCVTGFSHLQYTGTMPQNRERPKSPVRESFMQNASRPIEPQSRPLSFDLIPQLHQ